MRVVGNCDDEGTIFSATLANITTDAQVEAYIREFYAPTISLADMRSLLTAYPSDPVVGSPYDTLLLNTITYVPSLDVLWTIAHVAIVYSPQFKRLASFQGDIVFQSARRYFFGEFLKVPSAKLWAYI